MFEKQEERKRESITSLKNYEIRQNINQHIPKQNSYGENELEKYFPLI